MQYVFFRHWFVKTLKICHSCHNTCIVFTVLSFLRLMKDVEGAVIRGVIRTLIYIIFPAHRNCNTLTFFSTVRKSATHWEKSFLTPMKNSVSWFLISLISDKTSLIKNNFQDIFEDFWCVSHIRPITDYCYAIQLLIKTLNNSFIRPPQEKRTDT